MADNHIRKAFHVKNIYPVVSYCLLLLVLLCQKLNLFQVIDVDCDASALHVSQHFAKGQPVLHIKLKKVT